MIQSLAYFEKKRHGNPLLMIGLVNVFGCAVNLLGEPSGGAALLD